MPKQVVVVQVRLRPSTLPPLYGSRPHEGDDVVNEKPLGLQGEQPD